MDTRKPLNASVWRLGWMRKRSMQTENKNKNSFNANADADAEGGRAKRLVGLGRAEQELTDWNAGQVRWAKIAEPSPNAPYCAALCSCGLI